MAWPQLHPAAERELAEAVNWYEERSSGLGGKLYTTVDAVMSRIGDRPELYAVWQQNPRYRRAILRDFPFAVFYRVYETRTVVLAIAHTSRRPGYWLDRA